MDKEKALGNLAAGMERVGLLPKKIKKKLPKKVEHPGDRPKKSAKERRKEEGR